MSCPDDFSARLLDPPATGLVACTRCNRRRPLADSARPCPGCGCPEYGLSLEDRLLTNAKGRKTKGGDS